MRACAYETKHIDQEFRKFKSYGCQPFGLMAQLQLLGFLEDCLKKMACHGGAAAGGGDDGIYFATFDERSEDRQKTPGQLAGLVAITGIEGGLPAAGLLLREDDLDAVFLQQFAGGDTHAGVEHIHHTGDEQGDAPGSSFKCDLVHGIIDSLQRTLRLSVDSSQWPDGVPGTGQGCLAAQT